MAKLFSRNRVLRFLNVARWTAVLLTIAALVVQPHLPPKVLQVIDGATELYPYSDSVSGGNSHSKWMDEGHRHFQCHIKEGAEFRFCGVAIKFRDGNGRYRAVDLRQYEKFILHVSYKGPASRLMLFYRNSDHELEEKLFDSVVFSRDQFIYTFLEKPELNQSVEIGLDTFDLADWWLQGNYKQRSQIRRGVERVVEIGLATYENPPPGYYDFEIKKLEVHGQWMMAHDLYRYIISVWLLWLIFEGALRIALMQSERRLYVKNIRLLNREVGVLEREASKDYLTGVLNRTGFVKNFDRLPDVCEGYDYYVYVIDADYFKKINDQYGHGVGDEVLKYIASKIVENVRSDDLFARWGGEEFILVSAQRSEMSAAALAEKIRNVISMIPCLKNEDFSVRVTVSIGGAKLKASNRFDEAFKQADQNLYRAKLNGRNCVCI